MAETQIDQREDAAAAAQPAANRMHSHTGAAVATLSAGAVVAVGLSLGNVWMSRTGIFVAALAGLGALVLALRDLSASEAGRLDAERGRRQAQQGWRQAETDREDAERAAADRIRSMERQHHDETMGIIERFSYRVSELGVEIAQLQAEASRQRAELEHSEHLVGSLRSTQQVLLDNAVEARARIARLEQQISTREAELQQLADTAAIAEVVTLPVRRQLLPVADGQRAADAEVVVWDEAVGH